MIEGHPLAKRGLGGQALGLSITASFMGNWVGILLLVACMPIILAIALEFRSWEMFLLAVIGISICGTMTSGTMPLKGWITGWLGMLLAFVGYDTIHGVPRFTFDIPALYDGISYVAILIGLFGLAEIMKVLPQREHTPMPENVGRAIPSVGLLIKPHAGRAALRPDRHRDRRHSRRRRQYRGRSWPMTSAAGAPARRKRPNGARAASRPSSAPRSPTTPVSAARCCRR